MKIELKKFGEVLLSRQAGKEAYLAYSPNINEVGGDEKIEIDFKGVSVFSPSWGGEFLRPLKEKFGDKIILTNTENPSVGASLETLKLAGLDLCG